MLDATARTQNHNAADTLMSRSSSTADYSQHHGHHHRQSSDTTSRSVFSHAALAAAETPLNAPSPRVDRAGMSRSSRQPQRHFESAAVLSKSDTPMMRKGGQPRKTSGSSYMSSSEIATTTAPKHTAGIVHAKLNSWRHVMIFSGRISLHALRQQLLGFRVS